MVKVNTIGKFKIALCLEQLLIYSNKFSFPLYEEKCESEGKAEQRYEKVTNYFSLLESIGKEPKLKI